MKFYCSIFSRKQSIEGNLISFKIIVQHLILFFVLIHIYLFYGLGLSSFYTVLSIKNKWPTWPPSLYKTLKAWVVIIQWKQSSLNHVICFKSFIISCVTALMSFIATPCLFFSVWCSPLQLQQKKDKTRNWGLHIHFF
jgi:hypothetical protein